MANEIEEANALTRQALELAGREQDMLERAHPSAFTHEFYYAPIEWVDRQSGYAVGAPPDGDGWFVVGPMERAVLWARRRGNPSDD